MKATLIDELTIAANMKRGVCVIKGYNGTEDIIAGELIDVLDHPEGVSLELEAGHYSISVFVWTNEYAENEDEDTFFCKGNQTETTITLL